MYQRDREQLIGALTAKHQESVNFYEEAQRLVAQVSELRGEVERRTQERDSLSHQYEEKQQALFTALNDIAVMRQRRAELETHSADARLGKSDTVADASSVDGSSAVVNDLQLEVQRCRDLLAEKDAALQKRERCIGDLETSLREANLEVEAERKKCYDVAARLRCSEEALSSRTAELLASKKHCESLSFELQGTNVQRSELASQRDLLQQRSDCLTSELQALQSAHGELRATVGSREFELTAFREQVASMQRLMESGQADGNEDKRKEEEVHLLRDQLAGIRQQAIALQNERDQAYLAIQQQQAECTQLRNEVSCPNNNYYYFYQNEFY